MLEKMNEFFNNRVGGYEKHQLNEIESAKEFYPFTAGCLPMMDHASVLDLGCGTGLELEYYYDLNPSAKITGIDLSGDMLQVLKRNTAIKNRPSCKAPILKSHLKKVSMMRLYLWSRCTTL